MAASNTNIALLGRSGCGKTAEILRMLSVRLGQNHSSFDEPQVFIVDCGYSYRDICMEFRGQFISVAGEPIKSLRRLLVWELEGVPRSDRDVFASFCAEQLVKLVSELNHVPPLVVFDEMACYQYEMGGKELQRVYDVVAEKQGVVVYAGPSLQDISDESRLVVLNNTGTVIDAAEWPSRTLEGALQGLIAS